MSIILPLSRPAIATVAIFSFLDHWNQFIQPLIFLNDPKKFTVAIGLRYFNASPFTGDQPREAVLMAASMITAAPCLALFLAAQQYFVKGIVLVITHIPVSRTAAVRRAPAGLPDGPFVWPLEPHEGGLLAHAGRADEM